MTGFTFQSLKPQDSLSNELRSVIRDNVLQFYTKGLSTEAEEEGLTALYERLSQEDKLDGESNSIANQRAICEDYIARHEDLELVCEPFVDDGYSGVSFNRPQFKKLEEAIRKGALDCIVVKDLSRFSRNYIDGGRYIEKIFPQLGMLTRNPERGKSPSSITSSVHLTSHGQSKMPVTQVKKSKERHSR